MDKLTRDALKQVTFVEGRRVIIDGIEYGPLSPCVSLIEVRADLMELLKSIEDYYETFTVHELESLSKQKLDLSTRIVRLKNKITEHFS